MECLTTISWHQTAKIGQQLNVFFRNNIAIYKWIGSSIMGMHLRSTEMHCMRHTEPWTEVKHLLVKDWRPVCKVLKRFAVHLAFHLHSLGNAECPWFRGTSLQISWWKKIVWDLIREVAVLVSLIYALVGASLSVSAPDRSARCPSSHKNRYGVAQLHTSWKFVKEVWRGLESLPNSLSGL